MGMESVKQKLTNVLSGGDFHNEGTRQKWVRDHVAQIRGRLSEN